MLDFSLSFMECCDENRFSPQESPDLSYNTEVLTNWSLRAGGSNAPRQDG